MMRDRIRKVQTTKCQWDHSSVGDNSKEGKNVSYSSEEAATFAVGFGFQ